MTERGGWRAAVVAAAGAAALALLVWVATRAPVRLLDAPDSSPQLLPVLPTTTATTPGTTQSTTAAAQTPPPAAYPWLGTLLAVLFAALFVAVLGACVVLLVRAVRSRRRGPLLPGLQRGEAAPDLPTAVAAAVAARRAQQEDALRHGQPRNAVVACWLELEDAVRASGLRPRDSETAAELTGRVLGSLDVDRSAIHDLAALYREARFSRHPMDEADREAAIAALHRLHADLSVVDLDVLDGQPADGGRAR